MSAFLDPMVDQRKRIGRGGPLWCHLIADSVEELHALADRIGLQRSWFQDKASFPHYDVGSERIRELAIKAGAISCDRRTFVGHLQRIRAAAREGTK